MHNPQTHISADELDHRRHLARMYVDMTHIMHRMAFPGRGAIHGDLETLLVLICVFIADAEGRPASASKIAAHANMPRATVHRKLDELIKIGKIMRSGRSYCYAPGAITPDSNRKLAKVVELFVNSQASKSDTYKVAI